MRGYGLAWLGIAMELFENQEVVNLTMSPEEWAQLRKAYQAAWFFIRDATKNSIPTGRTFGRGLAPEVELEDLRDRVRQLESKTSGIEQNYVTEVGFEDLIGRVRRLESQTRFESTEDDARLRDLEATATKALDRLSVLREELSDAARRISKLEDRLERSAGDDMAQPWEVWAEIQMDKFAAGMRQLSEQGNADRDRVNNVYADISALLDRRELKSDVSSRLYSTPPTHASSFAKGADHGLEIAVMGARSYMAGHFSEATIGGVVQAIRDGKEKVFSPIGMDLSMSFPTHSFAFDAGDRRRCSFTVGTTRCNRTRSEHSD